MIIHAGSTTESRLTHLSEKWVCVEQTATYERLSCDGKSRMLHDRVAIDAPVDVILIC